MTLDIYSGERDLLMRLLEQHALHLIHEIARADSRAFRTELQRELAQVEGLKARVSRVSEEGQHPVL